MTMTEARPFVEAQIQKYMTLIHSMDYTCCDRFEKLEMISNKLARLAAIKKRIDAQLPKKTTRTR